MKIRRPIPFDEKTPARLRPACQQYDISDTEAVGPKDVVCEESLRAAEREQLEELESKEDGAPLREPLVGDHWPKAVRACHEKRWVLCLWPKHGTGTARKLVRYKCGSRRHPGECRDAWRQQLFCRLRDGSVQSVSPKDVAFVTFTLDSGFHRRLSRSDIAEGHRLATLELGRWLDAMNLYEKRRTVEVRERLAFRRDGAPVRIGAGATKLAYFWCREETKRGVCHLHMILASRTLAAECVPYNPDADWHPAPDRWQRLASAGGVFGRMDASRCASRDALAGYVSKVASTTSYGELVKASQSPEGHALRQRSYGASRGFLAPVDASDWTGELLSKRGECLVRVDGKGRVSKPDDDYEWTLELDLRGLAVLPDLE